MEIKKSRGPCPQVPSPGNHYFLTGIPNDVRTRLTYKDKLILGLDNWTQTEHGEVVTATTILEAPN